MASTTKSAPRVKRKHKAVWPAATVEMRPVAEIIPYEENPRWHPDAQIKLLAQLMVQHGVDQPIVVDETGTILKGHGRRLAAMVAGFKEFPVVVHKNLSDTEKTALRIADNQVAILAGWDDELLRMQVNQLRNAGFDLPMLGFDDGQLNAFGLEVVKGETSAVAEWSGMPEFIQEDKTAWRSVVVHFKNEDALKKFCLALQINIPEKQKYIWYPAIEIEHYVDKQYADG